MGFFHCIYCWQMKAGMWQFISFCYFHMHVIVTDDNVSGRCSGVTLGGRAGSRPALASEWLHERVGCHSSLTDGTKDQKKKKQTNPKLWCRVNERGFWPVSAQLETLSAGPAAVTKALTQLQTAAPTNLKMSKQFGDSEGLKSMLGWKEEAHAHVRWENRITS